jgi:hypothetical protein
MAPVAANRTGRNRIRFPALRDSPRVDLRGWWYAFTVAISGGYTVRVGLPLLESILIFVMADGH